VTAASKYLHVEKPFLTQLAALAGRRSIRAQA